MAFIQSQPKEPHIVFGVDIGTSFTTVSYANTQSRGGVLSNILLKDVKAISQWPHDTLHGGSQQVPTQSWYSNKPFSRDAADPPPEKQEPIGSRTRSLKKKSIMAVSTPLPALLSEFSPSQVDPEISSSYKWGYGVDYLFSEEIKTDRAHFVKHPKLLLIQSKHAKKEQALLLKVLRSLAQEGIINTHDYEEDTSPGLENVIADFLSNVLYHTKQIVELTEGVRLAECRITVALSVPVNWPAKSSRIIQTALATASRITSFCELNCGTLENIFLITEPEAAATFLIMQKPEDFKVNQIFCILDCGGGTVDASTYKLSVKGGRLPETLVPPVGDNCGATYLNSNFESRLQAMLSGEDYLDQQSRDQSIQVAVAKFEVHTKRQKNLLDNHSTKYWVPGLRGNSKKRFDDDQILVQHSDFENICEPLLDRVGKVLQSQLDAALAAGDAIKKFFMIGGFAAAPTLQHYLDFFVWNYTSTRKLGYSITLVRSDASTCVTAIASGAVLRALRMRHGPQRLVSSSYGFLRYYDHDTDRFPSHKGAEIVHEQFDGTPMVATIDYFMIKGELIDTNHTFPPIQFTHPFPKDNTELVCEDILYVSDHATRSHYCISSKQNSKAYQVGKIVTHFTFLLDDPSFKLKTSRRGDQYYEVTYDLFIRVESRTLIYEARYPAGSDNSQVLEQARYCIVSAFKPGTA